MCVSAYMCLHIFLFLLHGYVYLNVSCSEFKLVFSTLTIHQTQIIIFVLYFLFYLHNCCEEG
jgi:hypothetical protein